MPVLLIAAKRGGVAPSASAAPAAMAVVAVYEVGLGRKEEVPKALTRSPTSGTGGTA